MAATAVSKDASTITVTTPVLRGRWHGRNNGKDASNRGNATGNNQPAQQKDERVDKRSGSEDATRGDRAAVKGLLPLTGNIPFRGCCAIQNSREDLPGRLEGQWRWRWMPWRCDDGRLTTMLWTDAALLGRCPTYRRASLRRREANNAATLGRQLLRHHEPDAAQGEEARRACATWPGLPGSNRTQQTN